MVFLSLSSMTKKPTEDKFWSFPDTWARVFQTRKWTSNRWLGFGKSFPLNVLGYLSNWKLLRILCLSDNQTWQCLHGRGHGHVQGLGRGGMERDEGKGRSFQSVIIPVVRNWIKVLSATSEIFADAVLSHIVTMFLIVLVLIYSGRKQQNSAADFECMWTRGCVLISGLKSDSDQVYWDWKVRCLYCIVDWFL